MSELNETKNVSDFVKTCYSLKPKTLFLNELIWKFAVRNVLRGENILLVGQSGSAKTTTARAIIEALHRPFFNIPLGSTQDPRSSLVGNTHYDKKKGTFFSESYFVKAIKTPNAVILLDELSRAHPEAWNLLMPVLDSTQRFLRIDEEKDNSQSTINLAPGVSFISTANIGTEYTATRVLDRALVDRFTIVEIPSLSKTEEAELLTQRFPQVDNKTLEAIAEICSTTRMELKTETSILQNCLSTRSAIKIASLINDGFDLTEAAEVAIFPFFSADGGATSERTYIKQLVQKFSKVDNKEETQTPSTTEDLDVLFTEEDIKNATA